MPVSGAGNQKGSMLWCYAFTSREIELRPPGCRQVVALSFCIFVDSKCQKRLTGDFPSP